MSGIFENLGIDSGIIIIILLILTIFLLVRNISMNMRLRKNMIMIFFLSKRILIKCLINMV